MITVIDPQAARAALAAGLLGCPQPGCDGRLRTWSRARPRPVRGLDARVEVIRPDRGRCRACGVTHVLLPASCLPRRGYRVEVIGAALHAAANGAGYVRAALACGAPVGTVRDWIRAARRGSTRLIGLAVDACCRLPATAAAHGHARNARCRRWPPPMYALQAAAHALPSLLDTPRRPAARTDTGIDHLALITRQHPDRVLRHDLRVADPAALAHAGAWQRVGIITAGRLLTAATA